MLLPRYRDLSIAAVAGANPLTTAAFYVRTLGGTLFQASNGTTPATANNNPVGYWLDERGGKNPIQATAGSKPLLKTAIPSVQFDGTDDYLAYAGALADTLGTVFIAFKTGATAFSASQVIVSAADEGAANKWFEIGLTSEGKPYAEYNAAGTKHTVVGSSFLDTSTAYSLMVAFDSTDYYMSIGAVEQNPLEVANVGSFGWFGSVAGADNLVLGGAVTSDGLVRPFKGDIIELAIWSTDIT